MINTLTDIELKQALRLAKLNRNGLTEEAIRGLDIKVAAIKQQLTRSRDIQEGK